MSELSSRDILPFCPSTSIITRTSGRTTRRVMVYICYGRVDGVVCRGRKSIGARQPIGAIREKLVLRDEKRGQLATLADPRSHHKA